MKKTYNKTNWIDYRTPVCANSLNKIESALEDLYENALDINEIKAGSGIDLESNSAGVDGNNIKISVDNSIMKSSSCKGIEWVLGDQESYEENKLYFVLNENTKKLEKIILDGVEIFNVI